MAIGVEVGVAVAVAVGVGLGVGVAVAVGVGLGVGVAVGSVEDVVLQLGCNSRVATDDVGEPCRLDRRQRVRIQIGFVPEAVSIAQALELIG